VDGVSVTTDAEGDDAFLLFMGPGTAYRDETPGVWAPTTNQVVLWGTAKLLDAAKNKIRIELRLGMVFDDGVQFAQLKGKSVDAPPLPICPMEVLLKPAAR
jgi:hypothetical protein